MWRVTSFPSGHLRSDRKQRMLFKISMLFVQYAFRHSCKSLQISVSVTECVCVYFFASTFIYKCTNVCAYQKILLQLQKKCLQGSGLEQANKQVEETLQSMRLHNILSQSVPSGVKLLKHLANTKKLTDHLAAIATHFRGQWASPRQPITPLNPPPPYSSYVFHLPIHPSPNTSQWRSRVRPC